MVVTVTYLVASSTHTAKPPRLKGGLHPNNMAALVRALEDAGVGLWTYEDEGAGGAALRSKQ